MKKGFIARQFTLLATMLGGIFGNFGGGRRRNDEFGGDVETHQMRDGNTRKKAKQVAKDRRNRHRSGHGKYHRRSYLLGKPSTRHV